MNVTPIGEEIESLRHLTTGQLKDKYLEVFGEESRSNPTQFPFRRIAWRISWPTGCGKASGDYGKNWS